MLFNSVQFAIFTPIIFAIYWISSSRLRWIVILIASYYFYMSWDFKYILLILIITICSYFGAIVIDKIDDIATKKIFLYIVIAISIALLIIFKYWNFLTDTLEELGKLFNISMHPLTSKLILPVGISFYTFQAIGYIIDVYQGSIKAEYHFGKYAAFISFFPQLVAGPIERTKNLLPQIGKEHVFDYSMACYGIKRMSWGFFKKLVIADSLALVIDPIFSNVYGYQGASLLIVSLFFSFQIYCDFSGYSDIALGTANLFGIQLTENFKSPYFSSSLKEFWKRWHISLSSWLQDYIYVPLGGNRKGKFSYYKNIMLVFLVSGLWHGAAWHFILWGGGTWRIKSFRRYLIQEKEKRQHNYYSIFDQYYNSFFYYQFNMDIFQGWSKGSLFCN